MLQPKPGHILEIEARVSQWVGALVGSADLLCGPTATFRHGSARMIVDVVPHKDDLAILKVICQLVEGATSSPELFEYVARENFSYLFGRIEVLDGKPDGKVDVWFEHNMLANYLVAAEVNWAVGAVASTADKLDTEIARRFGGTTTHEDVAPPL